MVIQDVLYKEMKIKYTIIFLFSLLAQIVSASPIVIPSHSNLLERADLVITASFVKTVKTEERRKIRHHHATRVLSHFTIDSVLKGKLAEPDVVVGHYARPPKKSQFDEVCLTTWHFSFISFKKSHDKYLIYLKKQKSGKYTPVTGEIDPQYSFWKLESKKESTAEQIAAPLLPSEGAPSEGR